jgi:serine/threonine-protein kinase
MVDGGGDAMSAKGDGGRVGASGLGSLSATQAEGLDRACDRFEAEWGAGGRPSIEDYLEGTAEPVRSAWLAELIAIDLDRRRRLGERPAAAEYHDRFPGQDNAVTAAFGQARGQAGPRAAPARAMDPARGLLLGLLAFQNHFIDREALLAALGAWVADKATPLGQILVDRRALDPATHALLEGLAKKHLEVHGGEAEKSLAALAPSGPTRELLAQLGDPDIQASLSHVGSGPSPAEPDSDRTVSYCVGSATSEGQRFRVLRPHARGGLGAVYVALDAELNREVALKQILEKHADDPSSRARFLLEAEITGGLEHPGIVPVYGLGTYADGRPYYAMRFIRGDSLKEAIDRFHGDETLKKKPGHRSLELRKLLRRFLDVCNAVDYAHSRGVLHRDIKPGNVIVGKHGETLVVDWGLAKATGRGEPGQDAGERTLVPLSASGSAETMPGSALGTPAFMSPEQAEGDLEHLGARTDVYSLGATLYYLLTGQPPAEGEIDEVIRAVKRGELRPPRQVDATVDRALEAVCLKAVARRPADRYASAKALAEDVERWMADEPVSAWREPLSRQVRRWAKRNRTAVTAATATLFAGLIGLSAVLVVQTKAKAEITAALGRETTANRELTRSRAAVQARYELATEAIKTFHTGVSEDFLLKEDRFKGLRDQLLKSAQDFYSKLGALLGKETDFVSRRALATSNYELAQLTAKVGRTEDALAAHRAALAAREALGAEPGADAAVQVDVGRSLMEVARLLNATGQSGEALATLRKAVAILEGHGAGSSEARSALAACRASIGALLMAVGRHQEALVTFRLALSDQEALAATAKSPDEARRDQSEIIHRIGIVFDQTDRVAEAEAEFRRALAIRRELVERNPAVAGYRYRLAASHNSVGIVLSRAGRSREAEAEYRAALAIYRELVERNPGVTDFRNSLANIRLSLGILLYNTGRWPEAEPEFRAALGLWRELAEEHPAVTELRSRLADAHYRLGDVLSDTSRPRESEAEYRAALALQRELAEHNPTVTLFRERLADTHNNLGALLEGTGAAQQAEVEFRRCLALWRELAEANPTIAHFRTSLANCHNNLGAVMTATGRPQEARLEIQQALALRRELAAADPATPVGRWGLAQSLISLAELDSDAGRLDAAIASVREGVVLFERLANEHPAVTDYRSGLARALTSLGRALLRTGRPGEAQDPLRRASVLREAIPGLELGDRYDQARGLALLASASAAGEAHHGRAAAASSAADRAMAALTAAMDAGYRKHPSWFLADPDLAALRDRSDFRLLMMDLAMPADPFAQGG